MSGLSSPETADLNMETEMVELSAKAIALTAFVFKNGKNNPIPTQEKDFKQISNKIYTLKYRDGSTKKTIDFVLVVKELPAVDLHPNAENLYEFTVQYPGSKDGNKMVLEFRGPKNITEYNDSHNKIRSVDLYVPEGEERWSFPRCSATKIYYDENGSNSDFSDMGVPKRDIHAIQLTPEKDSAIRAEIRTRLDFLHEKVFPPVITGQIASTPTLK